MQIPSVVKKFLAEHEENPNLLFTGEIDTFDDDVHAIELDPDGADDVLAGDEEGFDDTKHAPLGFLVDKPIFIDLSSKALPVMVLVDGEITTVAESFEAFVEACEEDEDDEDEDEE